MIRNTPARSSITPKTICNVFKTPPLKIVARAAQPKSPPPVNAQIPPTTSIAPKAICKSNLPKENFVFFAI